jgi:hypothetical protein
VVESLRRRAGRFGLDIVLINEWEGGVALQEARRYCEMWNIDATVLLDETGDFARAVGVRGVPTNVFVDEGGIVQAVGASTSEELVRGATRLVPELAGALRHLTAADRVPGGFAE